MDDPTAFATKHYPNTMYFHQTVKQPDAQQCCVGHAVEKEHQDKTDNQVQSQTQCAWWTKTV
eukprot:58064-Ditylum_brightwellii.AAC.1